MESQKSENEFLQDTSGKADISEEVIRIRKDKIKNYFTKNYNWLVYLVLAVIVYLSVKIRTSNLAGLRDITTGGWTLGPDLDPFLFLRWAKDIVESGSLVAMDMMRYVPLGFNTERELILHTYLIVWFHKVASMFGSESVTHSAVLYPVFMFALAVIAFFFMTRKIFLVSLGKRNSSIVALIASFFLSVLPVLLPRTVAGIPEKEASALVFMFLTFYFYLSSWESKGKRGIIFALLAGIATGCMGLVWGGFIYVFSTMGLAVFIAFILGKFDKGKILNYLIWLASSMIIMISFTAGRYNLSDFITSTTTAPAIFVLFLSLVDLGIFHTKAKKIYEEKLSKIPRQVFSLIVTIIVSLLLLSVALGPSFLVEKAQSVKNTLLTPVVDRLGVTVAENRQPYFIEWEANFGPHVFGIALFFWLMFIGSVYLFYNIVKTLGKKEARISTIAYFVFLVALIFSRYSDSGRLNGTNFLSVSLYAIGFIVLLVGFGREYWKIHKASNEENVKKVEFSLLLLISFFIISVISARSAVRLIMMLVPSASILVGYLLVSSLVRVRKVKDSTSRGIAFVIVGIMILAAIFSGYSFYKESYGSAQSFVPSVYTQQWQKAMSWVRANTSEDAVFGHWWDYGYWVQTIGERATVLDGGNAISYWNHFMGRYALTGSNNTEALEFLYAHNTTHFLIDSTDIGKYGAFSSIGSDENYDRSSFITSFIRDARQTQEKKNSSVYVYLSAGIGLDEDIVYELNGTKIFLPSGRAGLGGIIIEKTNSSGEIISQPQGIFVYQGQQYSIPFRYAFDGEFKDFGSGIESGVFLMPRIQQSGTSISIDEDGALFYLSKRTVKSQLARLYLYEEENPNFVQVHSEDDFFIAQIKSQRPDLDYDFINVGGEVYEDGRISIGGVRGPIRIWEIRYPAEIEFKPQYLEKTWPAELLN